MVALDDADPAPELLSARCDQEWSVFLKNDHHWHPQGVVQVAQGLARFLEQHIQSPLRRNHRRQ